MKRLSKYVLLFSAVAALAFAIDYWNVTRKEKLLSSAVSQIGGRIGSIPLWPIGTEYRIALNAVPTSGQLDQLKVANEMRGWVGIAFVDCELTGDERDRLRVILDRCHLYLVQNGTMVPLDDVDGMPTNHPLQPSGGVGRVEMGDHPPRGDP